MSPSTKEGKLRRNSIPAETWTHIPYPVEHLVFAQSCLILCEPMDCSSPDSSVPGILQARTLERVAIPFSNACMHAKSLQSCLTLCDPVDSSPPGSSVPEILYARILGWVAFLSPLGKNTGLDNHSLLQKDFPNPGIEPVSPTLQVNSLLPESPGKPISQWKTSVG